MNFNIIIVLPEMAGTVGRTDANWSVTFSLSQTGYCRNTEALRFQLDEIGADLGHFGEVNWGGKMVKSLVSMLQFYTIPGSLRFVIPEHSGFLKNHTNQEAKPGAAIIPESAPGLCSRKRRPGCGFMYTMFIWITNLRNPVKKA